MTRAEKEARLATIKEDVAKKVEAYNEAMLDSKLEDAIKINEETAELVNEYTGIARGLCFEDCEATDDPMLEAVKRLTFTTIAVKDAKENDENIATRRLIDKEMQIDILKLHNKVKGGIGHNKQWNFMIEHFNLLMTIQVAKNLNIDPKDINDSYDMHETSRQMDLGKNPVSKRNLLKTLTGIVQAMIGEEYKPLSHDVNYLLLVYGKKSRKALTVTCANHKYLRGYIMEICHRIVTGKAYSVDYKKIK